MGSTGVAAGTARYEGLDADALAVRLGVSRLALFDEISSTMDVAHTLAAEGARAGTLVVADRQTAGRGRGGRAWVSAAGSGVWLTLIGRPRDAETASVLALRVGVHLALALDPFAESEIGLKWPNDLLIQGGKVAGVLVETRWQDQRPVWVAIGVGINVERPGGVARAAGLRPGASRLAVLGAAVGALRAADEVGGVLLAAELAEFARRDIARGHRCLKPGVGVVAGIAASGEVLIAADAGGGSTSAETKGQASGQIQAYRSGSLVLEGEGVS